MAKYLVHHTHQPDVRGAIFEEWTARAPWKTLDIETVLCTCPTGDHGGLYVADADSPEQILEMLGPVYARTTKVYAAEVMALDPASLTS